MAAPLTKLTQKGSDNSVKWDKEQEEAFSRLKAALAKPPILLAPDLGKEFVLRTDASDESVGAVLFQEKDKLPHPVAYASRKLSKAERNYATIEKERLALVWTIGRFTLYLYGRKFRVQTDHQPLEYLNRAKHTNSRVMRWSMKLQDYDFHMEYIKGCDNVGADFLSRI